MLTIKQIYNLAISLGIKNDLRGQKQVLKTLVRAKERFQELKTEDKKYFDQECLVNPFADSRILFGKLDQRVSRILVGIDIGSSELLLAKNLSERKPIDLVISHHPRGRALAGLDEVMHSQIELLAQYGVPINIAEKITKIRISEVSRLLSPGNVNREIDTAKLLNIPLMCLHTPADNLAASFFDKFLEKNKNKLERVGDILKFIRTIPEYQLAEMDKIGPKLFVGSSDNYTGKIAITELAGGTEGSKEIYEKMAQAGIGTIIAMHMKEEHRQEAEKAHINVVVAGHMPSDSLGMNIFLDELERKGIEIVPCSGLIRIRRKSRK